jgi:PIF1-like helicase
VAPAENFLFFKLLPQVLQRMELVGELSIRSSTLPSLKLGYLKLGYQRSHGQINADTLQYLQAMFRGVSHLIVNERSMISIQRLGAIDRRCRNIFTQRRDESFGGLNVILAGDSFQLPAVAGKALFSVWNAKPGDYFDIQGQLRYRNFDKTIELDVVRR